MIEEMKTTKLPKGAISRKDNAPPLTIKDKEQQQQDNKKQFVLDRTIHFKPMPENKVLVEWGPDGIPRFNFNGKMQTLEEHIHERVEEEIKKQINSIMKKDD
jgi:hypothetical protein